MPKRRFSPEQIVTLLRQIEVAMSQGKSAQMASREAGSPSRVFTAGARSMVGLIWTRHAG
jgi:hypothetical protein